jgi:hypothetical protein
LQEPEAEDPQLNLETETPDESSDPT